MPSGERREAIICCSLEALPPLSDRIKRCLLKATPSHVQSRPATPSHAHPHRQGEVGRGRVTTTIVVVVVVVVVVGVVVVVVVVVVIVACCLLFVVCLFCLLFVVFVSL